MNRKYFEMAQEEAHESFFSADGFVDDYGNFTDGNYISGRGYNNANFASGASAPVAQVNSAPTSLPFVLSIANSTTNNVSNVVILGSNANLFNATNFGNVAAITITNQTGGGIISYTSFLENVKSNPFKVGKMYLQSTNNNQPFQALNIVTQKADGSSLSIPITPVIDPMQQQSGVTIISVPFDVNAFTTITTTILSNATLTMILYPAQDINVARGLSDNPASRGYSNPNIQYAQPIRVLGAGQ